MWRECEEGGGLLVVESARLEEDCSVCMDIMYNKYTYTCT